MSDATSQAGPSASRSAGSRSAPSDRALLGDDAPAEPAADAPLGERLAWALTTQSVACRSVGSALYADVLALAAAEADEPGPVRDVVGPQVAAGRSDALGLRLLALGHRLALAGRAPALAARLPSTGGDGDAAGAWAALRERLASEPDAAELLARPCQTNEIGRAAPLWWGLLEVARFDRPIRLLEIGASAGLLLRLDQVRCGDGAGHVVGPADSEVDLDGAWQVAPPGLAMADRVRVVERRGCDPRPVDPSDAEGQLALRASVWADQPARLARLESALALASRVPAQVDEALAAGWLPARLAETHPGVATVVMHAVVEEYLDGAERRALHEAVRTAGTLATPDAPLAWLRLEPVSRLRRHAVTLTTWPGGEERCLAVSGPHGDGVAPAPGGAPAA